jgi:hypothetical protein
MGRQSGQAMKHLALILTLFVGSLSHSKPLDPENYLLKISERLTGTWPKRSEYADLQKQMKALGCSEISCMGDYFKKYIDKKMDTPAFYSEASLKVHERFSLQTPTNVSFPIVASSSNQDNFGIESLLVFRILKENLPIDELFTSQIQWKVDSDGSSRFDSLLQFQVESVNEPITRDFTDSHPALSGTKLIETKYIGHPNVAGMFSSQKFLTRYWNSPINGNRKRAAAVFKIMLCDPMNPALERLTAKAREQALAQGVPDSTVTQRSIEDIHRNRHGNQKDCAQCHNRLDPLARTMRPLELGISKFASKGRLRFYDAVNQPIDFPTKNFHDLVTQITKQQKYTDCQMNWLFNWIVGKDVDIHPARFSELLEKFEKDGRRMKETIASLLLTPEFQGREIKFEMPPLFEKVRNVLGNCYECHSNFLKSHGAQLKLTLSKVSNKLDLANNGRERKMPPNYHYWEPSQQEVMTVKAWISEGAPLVAGKSLLTPEEVRTILGGKK